jgi:hypothetical protein
MIRVPQVYLMNLKTHGNKKVNRLVVAHPKSVQYVQHDPESAEVRIRYVSGQELVWTDTENPESVKKNYEDLVYQLKDCSD